MKKRLNSLMLICLVAVMVTFLSVDLVEAQTIFYGKLTGTVVDDTGVPLPGVALEISSEALISGTRSAVTSARGTYVFLNLPVGTYTLTASLSGFKTTVRENINMSAGRVVTVDLTMEMGTIDETITVIAASPVVDAKSSAISTNLENELLEKLPTSRDAFYDLSITTPGMFEMGQNAGWMPSPTAYGGAQNANVFLVNGVNTTNPRGANWGSMVHVNYNAVEEVRIVALGSKAEYGAFSGAAVDVLTKSGSNLFHGNLAFYTQLQKPKSNQPGPNEDLGRDWLYMTEGEDLFSQTDTDWEGNITLGGPLIKDKVWFYGGFDYVHSKTKIPVWPLLQGWWGRYIDAKISAEPLPEHRAWIAYHYEFNYFDNGNWGFWADPTMNYFTDTFVHSISSQWQWLASSNAIFTAKYLGFWTHDEPGIPDPEPGDPTWPGYTNWWKLGRYEVNGRFPWIEAMDSNRHTVQGDVSYYAEDFLGEHDIKFGAQYTVGHGNYLGGYFQGYAYFAYPEGYTYYIPNLINYTWYAFTDGMRFRNDKVYYKPHLTVRKGTQLGAFFDDQWSPTRRLTINFGVRFDNMRARYGEGKIYEVPETPNQINDPPPVERTRQGTDDIFNFTNISPRLGFIYDLTGDGKTVVRASWGRYYMPLTLENLRRYGPDMDILDVNRFYYKIPWEDFDMNNNLWVDPAEVEYWTRQIHDLTPWYDIWLTSDRSWQLQVADNIKNQFTDQVVLNLERELVPDLSLSASYIYRHTGNLMAQIPINEQTGQEWEYELVPYTTSQGENVQLYSVVKEDYNGDGVFTGADVQWIYDNNNFEVRNIGEYFGKKPKRNYHGFQLVFTKRYSNRWQGFASVLYSMTDGTSARAIHQDFNVEGMMITDDYWMSSLNNLVNNMDGPLPFTPKFEFKLSGSYTIPYLEADVGLRFRYHTGRPVWMVETISGIAASWMGSIPDDMIIQPASGGLSANIIGIDPNEPDYLPPQTLLDLHFEKAFKLSTLGSLHFILDVFNVFDVGTVTNAISNSWGYGQVTGLVVPPRKLRLSVRFEF